MKSETIAHLPSTVVTSNTLGISKPIPSIRDWFKASFNTSDFEKSESDSSEDIEKEFEQFKIFEKYALKYDTSEI